LLALQDWFARHIYIAILTGTVIEGLGLPFPAEALYLAGVAMVATGDASLGALILMGATGNFLGSMLGFSISYASGPRLLARLTRLVGINPQTLQKVERFFFSHGPATVFLSRFVGVIRAATIYTAGAAHMPPFRFALYMAAGALAWNTLWVLAIYRFGAHVFALVQGRAWRPLALWALGALLLYLIIIQLGKWARRFTSTD